MANQTAQGSFYVATNTKFLSSEINRNESMHRADLAALKTALFFGTPMVVSGLSVSPGTGLQVTVAPGNGFDGAGLPVFIPTSVPSTATAFGLAAEGTAPNANLATADPTNPRIDLVCLRAATLQTDYASIAVNNGTSTTNQTVAQTLMNYFQIVIVTGTPAASPVVPAALQATDLVVAQVLVPAASTSVSTGNITDRRKIMGGIPSINNANTFSALQTLTAGLTVSSGATSVQALTATGLLTAQNGLTVSAGATSLQAATAAGILTAQAGISLTGGNLTIPQPGLGLVSLNAAATVGDTGVQIAGKNVLGIYPGYVSNSMTSTLFVNTVSGTEGAAFPNLRLWGAVAIPQTLAVTGNTTIGGTLRVTGATTLSANLAGFSATFSPSALQSEILAVTDGAGNYILDVSSNGTAGKRMELINGSAFNIYSDGFATAVFKVVGSSGNTTIGGTLGVTGATTLAALTATTATISGNVGIGTTSPAQKLDVNGAIAIAGSTVIDASRNLFPNTKIDWGGNVTISYNAGNLNFTSGAIQVGGTTVIDASRNITGSLGTFSNGVLSGGTASTGASNANYWYKIATATLTSQYAYQSGVISLFTPNGSASNTSASAIVNFAVKQQSSMGSAPSVQVQILADYAFNAMARVVAVTTTNTTAQTVVTLYAQVAVAYENIQISLLNSYGGMPIINGDNGTSTLPAGTQTKPSSASMLLTDSGVGIGTTSPTHLAEIAAVNNSLAVGGTLSTTTYTGLHFLNNGSQHAGFRWGGFTGTSTSGNTLVLEDASGGSNPASWYGTSNPIVNLAIRNGSLLIGSTTVIDANRNYTGGSGTFSGGLSAKTLSMNGTSSPSTNVTLGPGDAFVVTSTSGITITLSTSMSNGQIVVITNSSSGNITISSNWVMFINGAFIYTFTLGAGRNIMFLAIPGAQSFAAIGG